MPQISPSNTFTLHRNPKHGLAYEADTARPGGFRIQAGTQESEVRATHTVDVPYSLQEQIKAQGRRVLNTCSSQQF